MIKEKYKIIRKNAVGMGIIVCLNLTDNSMKLQSLADMLGRKKNTVHHHLKSLLKDGYIEFDIPRMTEESGKYYKLGELTNEILKLEYEEFHGPGFEEKINKIKNYNLDEHFNFVASSVRKLAEEDILDIFELSSNLNSYVQNILLLKMQKLIDATKDKNDEELIQLIKESGIGMGNLDLAAVTIPISRKSQANRLTDLYFNFQKDLSRLKKEFIEE